MYSVRARKIIGGIALVCVVAVLYVGINHSTPESSSTAAKSEVESNVSTVEQKSPTSPENNISEDVKTACMQYGIVASEFAANRENGMSFRQQTALIKQHAPSPAVALELLSVADALYNQAYANKMTQDGAKASFFAECVIRVQKNQAGTKTIHESKDLNSALESFPTFDHSKLIALLKKYGLSVKFIEINPIAAMSTPRPEDKPGDLIYEIMISGKPKVMPCGLHKWIAQGFQDGHGEQLAEITVRDGKFLTNAEELDPVLYWAATNKCSEAYGLPL